MIATLAGEPWCKSIEEIRTLDDYQVREIIFHERDKEGRIKPGPREEPEMTPKEVFWQSFQMRCYPEWFIQKMWQKQQEAKPQEGESFQNSL